jgi:hypothetical protein
VAVIYVDGSYERWKPCDDEKSILLHLTAEGRLRSAHQNERLRFYKSLLILPTPPADLSTKIIPRFRTRDPAVRCVPFLKTAVGTLQRLQRVPCSDEVRMSEAT